MHLLTARWLLPVTAPPIARGAVIVDQDRIIEVGPFEVLRERFPAATMRDFGEAALLPGLINVHSHLELAIYRGRLEISSFPAWIAELVRLKRERLTDEDMLASTRLGCVEAIRHGMTTLADTTETPVVREALVESGLRGIIFQECFGPQAEQAAASIALLEAKLDEHAQRLEEKDAGARVRIGVSPHAPYSVSGELYQRATRLALDRGLDLAMHVAESPDESEFLVSGTGGFAEALARRGISWAAPGRSTIQYLESLGVLAAGPLLIHCVTADAEDLDLLARRRARLAHCPKSNAKLGHGIAPLIAAQRKGITVGLGSDSVGSNNTCDLIEEARFGALVQRAVHRDASLCPAEEMLRLMTIDGARTLRLDHLIGSLEAGKQADLIAIDLGSPQLLSSGDPATSIVFSASGRDVVFTMVAGRTLYETGRVIAVDENEIIERARAAAEKLLDGDPTGPDQRQ
jgi:5-methylthioadenosine/S-adenosylhomocysteine deaminase